MSPAGIRDAYASGRGSVKIRARAHVEPLKGGKEAIIVTELPFMVKKGGDSGLITKIADLVREKKLDGISDLRDESDRSGMRLVIELKRGAVPKVVLNNLYKKTAMQTTFGVNMVALVDGVPQTLSLRELIHHYVDHQREVVTRRTQYELRRAEARAHILEGLLVALDNLDAVIKLIRGSEGPRRRPRRPDRPVRALPRAGAGDPRHAPAAPHRARVRQGPRRARRPDRADRRAAGDPRRRGAGARARQGGAGRGRRVLRRRAAHRDPHFEGDVGIEDMIADQQMVISLTASGYVKRLPLATYRQQRRGGVGVMGMNMKEDDYIEHLHICSTHDFLLFFTNRGKVYRLKVYELPEGSRTRRAARWSTCCRCATASG